MIQLIQYPIILIILYLITSSLILNTIYLALSTDGILNNQYTNIIIPPNIKK